MLRWMLVVLVTHIAAPAPELWPPRVTVCTFGDGSVVGELSYLRDAVIGPPRCAKQVQVPSLADPRLVAATLQAAVQLPSSLYPEVLMTDVDGAVLDDVGAPLVLIRPMRIPNHATPCHEAARSDAIPASEQVAGFRAAAFHKSNAYSHLALAGVLQKQNQTALALAHYDAVVSLRPANIEHLLVPALHNSGLMLSHEMNDKQAAAVRFGLIIGITAANSSLSHMAHNELAIMDIATGDLLAAQRRLRSVLSHNPRNRLAGQNMAYALFNHAKAQSAAGNRTEAEAAHRELKQVVQAIADRRGSGPATQPPSVVLETSEYLPRVGYELLCPKDSAASELTKEVVSIQQRAVTSAGACDTQKLVSYVVPGNAGFGSIAHFATTAMAASLRRGMGFGFPAGSLNIYTGASCDSRSFDCLFQRTLNCSLQNSTGRSLMQLDAAPHEVPAAWAARHGVLWYRSVLMSVLWRLSTGMEAHVSRVSEAIGFSSRAIGMHVRHGDSCSDPRAFTMRRCYALRDYMQQAERMRQLYGVDTIFLATDDAQVELEARTGWPSWNFVMQPINRSRFDASADSMLFVDLRLLNGELEPETEGRDLVTDVTLLARCDYLITTFSSNLGRIAYELSFAWKGFTPPFVSMDIPFCSHWGHRWPVRGVPIAC